MEKFEVLIMITASAITPVGYMGLGFLVIVGLVFVLFFIPAWLYGIAGKVNNELFKEKPIDNCDYYHIIYKLKNGNELQIVQTKSKIDAERFYSSLKAGKPDQYLDFTYRSFEIWTNEKFNADMIDLRILKIHDSKFHKYGSQGISYRDDINPLF